MAVLAPVVAAVSGAFAGAASFLGGLGAFGRAIVGIGLSLAAKAFQKKPKVKTVGGTKLDVQYGSDQPREIGLGLFAVAGHDVYTNTYGKANKYISKVFVLSDFRIDGLERLAVNGEYTALGPADGDRGVKVLGDFEDLLWVKIVLGLPDQAADPFLIDTANPNGRWTAAHRLAGVAYAIVTAKWDDQKMNSFPQVLFECRGAPLYDVRRDTTAGGSGSHRWDDQSTWQFGDGVGTNPIVQAYCYERGFTVAGELIIGKGMPATDLPSSAWMAAANVCDEPVDGAARYRSGCLVTAADGVTHRDNLEPILEAAGAMLVEKVDGDQPIVGANQATVATLTDADLIVGERHTFRAKRSRSELINGVFGSYNSPADLWSSTAYKPVSNALALAADRERHAVQLDWEAVSDESQAVRLAETAIRQNRYQASAQIVVRPRWIALEIGDWIRWDSARRGNRVWQVVGRSLAPLGPQGARNVSLTLQEVGSGIYDGSVSIPEVTPRTPPAGPVYTLTVENFLLVATSVTAENGRVYPALQAQWDAIDDLTVTEVRVQYWKTSDPSVVLEKRVSVAQPYILLVEGVLPVTQYTAQASVVTSPPRDTVWSRQWSATTLAEDLAFQLELDLKEIRDIIAGGQEMFEEFEERLQALAVNVALITGKQLLDLGGVSARLLDEEKVRASQTDALATRTSGVETGLADANAGIAAASSAVAQLSSRTTNIEGVLTTQAEALTGVQSRLGTVEGTVSGQASALSSLQTTVSNQDATITATADAVTGVQATVGDLSASGLISFKVIAGGGANSASSRVAILTKAKASDSFKEAGIYIDTTATTSTILLRADKVFISDAAVGNQAQPFVVQGGVVKLAVGRFQQLISDNGKMVINGSNGTIELYD
ncbi:phage tail protein [Aureimonas leprariae]|uniref:DUF1983 domain-containing protein n=1 Tax=Plantimonas leprariae TaxID=2615207 RepID=A0A7V7TY57_9HYPH|nr:phage tail protein [Aureimonas leprariae]KAB0682015.1 DUF1983 domain-containing protein [Aureimonas leprariae]